MGDSSTCQFSLSEGSRPICTVSVEYLFLSADTVDFTGRIEDNGQHT